MNPIMFEDEVFAVMDEIILAMKKLPEVAKMRKLLKLYPNEAARLFYRYQEQNFEKIGEFLMNEPVDPLNIN